MRSWAGTHSTPVALGVVIAALALVIVLALAWTGARSGGSELGSVEGAERPNVLLILTDDQDLASLEVMGEVGRRLGGEGTTFANAFASLPQCCPSRATLLSGQYAHNHGVRDNAWPGGGYRAFDGENALPVWLQEAGYRTGWIGKYLNEYGNSRRGNDPREIPPGWSEWVAPVEHTDFQMYGYTLNRNGRLRSYGSRPRDYQTDVLARDAEAFVRESAEQDDPFFLTVAPLAPHREGGERRDRPGAARNPRPAQRHRGSFASEPLPRPPSFNERRDADKSAVITDNPRLDRAMIRWLTILNRSRLESLLAVDEMVGRLLAALEHSGQLERTLIIYTSDQGFLLGEHHLFGKNRLYEEALAVPLLMRGPGVEAGVIAEAVVGNVDLAPTILAATGVEPGLAMDGYSLLPADAEAPHSDRPGLLLELYDGGRFAGIRTSRYAYLDLGNRGNELYDLRDDPFQLENIAADPAQAETVRTLQGQVDRLRECAGVECR